MLHYLFDGEICKLISPPSLFVVVHKVFMFLVSLLYVYVMLWFGLVLCICYIWSNSRYWSIFVAKFRTFWKCTHLSPIHHFLCKFSWGIHFPNKMHKHLVFWNIFWNTCKNIKYFNNSFFDKNHKCLHTICFRSILWWHCFLIFHYTLLFYYSMGITEQ